MSEPSRNRQGLSEAEFLAQYDASRYARPSVTVDTVIYTIADVAEENYRKLPEKHLQVLLVRRSDHPFLGQWALPGGFATLTESLDEAAVRVLRREAGIENIYMEQLYTWGDAERDPRTRVISCSYLSLVDAAKLAPRPAAGAPEARWFTVRESVLEERKVPTGNGFTQKRLVALDLTGEGETLSAKLLITREAGPQGTRKERRLLDPGAIAFDHARIIQYGLERLRSKIEWTDTAFNLMPELFTLTDLQQVYEVILQQELLTANFRRKIAHMVLETNHYRRDAGHRPAKLYRFNPDWADTSL